MGKLLEMGRRQFILTIATLLALFGNYAKLLDDALPGKCVFPEYGCLRHRNSQLLVTIIVEVQINSKLHIM